MARHIIKADVTIKNAKPKAAMYRLSDGDGLYVLVKPDGAKWWRFDYSIGGKRKTLSLGVYPDTSNHPSSAIARESKPLTPYPAAQQASHSAFAGRIL